MIPVKQKIKNDCFRACMASILELPNNDSLPHIESEKWFTDWNNLLANFGISLKYDDKEIWGDGYWIATVPSLNFKNKLHAIVMYQTEIAFDPNIKKQYKKGTNLNELIKHGYWLEISDVSKLKNIDKFREQLLQDESEK